MTITALIQWKCSNETCQYHWFPRALITGGEPQRCPRCRSKRIGPVERKEGGR